MRATIDKSWEFVHSAKVFFTVVDPLDLNQDSTAKVII